MSYYSGIRSQQQQSRALLRRPLPPVIVTQESKPVVGPHMQERLPMRQPEVSMYPFKGRDFPYINKLIAAQNKGVGYVQPPDCRPPNDIGIPNAACIAEQARIQLLNMAEHNTEQRDVFLDNCNRDWAANDAQYSALGLPRPANTCDQRNFGLVPVGGYTGSPVQAAIPVTYLPPPAAPVVQSAPSTQTIQPQPAAQISPAPPPPVPDADNDAGGYIPSLDQATGFVTQDVGGFPMWAILAAGAGALYLFGGQR